MNIHRTVLVSPDANLADDITIDAFSIIGPKATIGRGTMIGPHVILDGTVTIGENCFIGAGTIMGNAPQDIKYHGQETTVVIGNNNIIREYVTINRGSEGRGETTIGDDNMIMSYVHIGHDCAVGNKVVMANSVTLGGCVMVEDLATIGGLTPIHQFVLIGTLAMVGGGSRCSRDVPPYCMAVGNPMRLVGLNTRGLIRNNVPGQSRSQLKQAYKILFRSNLNTSQALARIEKIDDQCDEIKHLIEFIEESSRGIVKELTK